MAAHRLSNHGQPFVVIEQNQEVIQTHEKIHFIAGDAQAQLMINPPADMKLESHSKLIVLGDVSAIGKLNAMFDLD